MNEQKQIQNLLTGLGASVVLAAALIWFGIFESTASTAVAASSSPNLQINPELKIQQRLPASINSAEKKFVKAKPFFAFDLICTDRLLKKKIPDRKVVSTDFLQLSGQNCGNHQKQKAEIKIQNKSNGFQASYFENGPREYKTDLIQLQPGENQIQIEIKTSSGQKILNELFVTSRR